MRDQAEDEVKQKTKELEDTQKLLSSEQKKNAISQKVIKKMTEENDKLTTKTEDLESKNKSLEVEISNLQEQINDKSDHITKSRKELSESKANESQLAAKQKELETQLEKANDHIKTKDTEIGKLKTDSDKLKTTLHSSKSDNSTKVNELIKENKREITILQEHLEEAKNEAKAKKEEVKVKMDENQALKKELSKLKQKNELDLSGKDLKIEKLQANLEAHEKELEDVKAKLSQEESNYKLMKSDKDKCEDNYEKAQKQIEDSDRLLKMAKEEIVALEAENADLRARISELEYQHTPEEETMEVLPENPESPPLKNFVNEKTDIKSFVESYLKYNGIDVPVKSTQNPTNKNTYNVTIGDKKISAKVNNNKFLVKGGGGWYNLQEYIDKFFSKMSASKKHRSSATKIAIRDSGEDKKSGTKNLSKTKTASIDIDHNLSITSNKSNKSTHDKDSKIPTPKRSEKVLKTPKNDKKKEVSKTQK